MSTPRRTGLVARSSIQFPWRGIMTLAVVLIAIFVFRSMNRIDRAGPSPGKLESEQQIPIQESRLASNDRKSNPKFLPEDESFQESLSLVSDRTLEIKPREMSSYWQMVKSVHAMTSAEVPWDSLRPIAIHDIFQHPGEHRGEMSSYEMVVHRVLEYDTSSDVVGIPNKIYEIWGSAPHSKNWLFVLITTQLPEGHDTVSLLKRKATFCGFFFKLQGYHPVGGKSSDRPLLAPMFIGKIRPRTEPQASHSTVTTPVVLYWFLGFSIPVMAVLLFMNWRKKKAKAVSIGSKVSEAIAELEVSLDDVGIPNSSERRD